MMNRDLFKLNLDDLKHDDVVQFTGILRPEIERPKEGFRLDFKEKIPNDIGDVIAAFSNTYGGLLILGVKSDKDRQNIPVEIIGIKGNPDIKTTIVNKILSTVYPRPTFSVGVAVHDEKANHVVVVIRVEESRITPHMFIAGQQNKISVRVEDENRYASLQQIETLFERKNKMTSESFAQKVSDLSIVWIDEYIAESRSANYHRVSLTPVDNLNILLDRKSEQRYGEIVSKAYRDKNINVDYRHARYYQIEARNKEMDYHRMWRLSSSGAIEFISQLGKGTPRQENLGDMIIDVISFLQICKMLFSNYEYFGDSYFKHEMSIARSTQLLPKMPPPHYMGDYDTMPGVNLTRDTVDSKIGPNSHSTDRYFDFSDLEAPDEILAQSFLEHLRMIFHASIDFDRLLEHIRYLRGLK